MRLADAPRAVNPTETISNTPTDGASSRGPVGEPYGPYPVTVRDHATLSGPAKFLWITLASFGRVVNGRIVGVHPSRGRLARACGWRDPRTVDRYLAELVAAELVEKEPRFEPDRTTGEMRQTSNRYRLTWPGSDVTADGQRPVFPSDPGANETHCPGAVECNGGTVSKPHSETTAGEPVTVKAGTARSAPLPDCVDPVGNAAAAAGLAATYDAERRKILGDVPPVELERGVLRGVGHKLREAGAVASEIPALVRWMAGHRWDKRRDLLRNPHPLLAAAVVEPLIRDWRAEGVAPPARDLDAERKRKLETDRQRNGLRIRQGKYLQALVQGAGVDRARDEAGVMTRDVVEWRKVPAFAEQEARAWRKGEPLRRPMPRPDDVTRGTGTVGKTAQIERERSVSDRPSASDSDPLSRLIGGE